MSRPEYFWEKSRFWVGVGIFILLVAVGSGVITYANKQQREKAKTEQNENLKTIIENAQKRTQTEVLDSCLAKADDDYWSWVKLNATSSEKTDDGTIYKMPQSNWEYADNKKKDDQDACYKRYK